MQSGSFPLDSVKFGPGFQAMVNALESEEFRKAFEEKFGVDLTGRPSTITVRGRCGAHDGKIHNDSTSKIITVLLYVNPDWDDASGRLRLLRSRDDIDDVAVEVPPSDGTLVAFLRSDRSWHGHLPFEGERRVIQFNWVNDSSNQRRALFLPPAVSVREASPKFLPARKGAAAQRSRANVTRLASTRP